MRKHCLRAVAILASVGLLAAFTGVGGAQAEPIGVGTSTATTTVFGVELGDAGSLLNLRILGDDAQSTIDSLISTPLGLSRLVPASLTSQVLPVLNGVTANLPRFESRTPGGQSSVSGAAIDLSSGNSVAPLPGLPLGKGILSGGIIPASLTSGVDADGARSALEATLANLSVVSGLLSVKSVTNTLGTSAAPSNSVGTRALGIDAISLLRLGDLLKGLGIDLANLPVATLSSLLSTLNLNQLLPTDSSNLLGAVNLVQAALADVTSGIGSNALTDLVQNVPVVSTIVSGLPAQLPVAPTSLLNTDTLLTGTLSNLLATLQATLSNLLGTAMNLLGNLSLLEFDGAQVSAFTKATASLDSSKADVVGTLGGLSVLGVPVPGVDLLAIAGQINAITSGVLGLIDPVLGGLVKVSVLDKVTSVATVNGYNRALASLDVLNLRIAPPANLLGLAGLLNASPTGALSTLRTAGVANPAAGLPVVGSAMGALNGLLNVPGLLGALAQGATLRVGSVQSVSDFQAAAPAPAAPAAPAEVTSLPRTGGTNGGQMATMAAILIGFSLVTRRFVRRSAVKA